ncbi:MAG: hypothetical protein J6W04_00950 [Bacteroidales bacterium]|nr:hypothetical protein [Bacteroidales bacterium]
MTDEYRNGEYDYATAMALIEEIIDDFQLRAYVYIQSDEYDNVMTSTMVQTEGESHDDVQFEAMECLIVDILKGRDEADKVAAIADIYDCVYHAIHSDDDDEPENVN